MNPKCPIYIVSKGRWESRLTSKALDILGVPYLVVIEEQEFPQYAGTIGKKRLLILDKKYQDDYDTCDDLGDTKSKGPGPARNFAWDHSIDSGFDKHWVMDDNISVFYRHNHNEEKVVKDGTIFLCMEDFVDRYENVAISGPNYNFMFPRKSNYPPFILNTRIYSCNLIRNDIPYRWRARYNEDTDLSLRALKDGWCTIQFCAFLQVKAMNQSVKGGNTEEFYLKEGTLPKSQMQVKLHPDVSRLVLKYGRWHHYVNYRPFRKNKLIRKKGLKIQKGIDNYGMVLKENPAYKKRNG